jgi:hypothetical protein
LLLLDMAPHLRHHKQNNAQSPAVVLERVTVGRGAAQSAFCPVRFVPNAKLTRLDKLAVAFDALALSRLTGCLPPSRRLFMGQTIRPQPYAYQSWWTRLSHILLSLERSRPALHLPR